jgi:TPR repeat protein
MFASVADRRLLMALAAVAAVSGGAAADPLPGGKGKELTCATGPQCLELGEKARDGDPHDDALSAQYYQRGCELGHALSCSSLGTLLSVGTRGVPRDEKRALALLEKACALKELIACRGVATMVGRGSREPGVITKDPARAATLYEGACTAGEAASCSILSDLYREGRGVKRDKKRAAELNRRAKKLGYQGE